MLYCETCRVENGWAYCRQHFGACDLCGKEGTCYGSDASFLRIRKRITLTSALEWAERMAERIAERKPDDVAETHLIMAHTIMDVQLEALALRRDPDFLQSVYDRESIKELHLREQKLLEILDKERECRKAQDHLHKQDDLKRAERHWKTACTVVGLLRSLVHFCHSAVDDASVRFSLLELT
jgi:hypothetical protein